MPPTKTGFEATTTEALEEEKPPMQLANPPTTITAKRKQIINLENVDYTDAITTQPFSTLNFAPHNATLLTNYRALAHPSQPNYIAQVVGDTILNSDEISTIAASCIVDLLEKKGISWASYNEEYPDNWIGEKPFLKEYSPNGKYVRRHTPLVSIASVQNSPERAKKIKSGEAFQKDLEAGNLPQYIYYTPNQDNNAHDTNIAYAGHYITEFLIPLLTHPHFTSRKSLFVLTFDETAFWVGKNRIATWLLGNSVKSYRGGPPSESFDTPLLQPRHRQSTASADDSFLGELLPPTAGEVTAKDSGTTQLVSLLASVFTKPSAEKGYIDKTKFDHYSILKTVEENWDLGNLGRKDISAVSFEPVLRPI
ncbi:hypothetical protein HK100_007044 [Physocladia obscura]|uniref:Acid phosphatase n=1 Tax=Physocladia obscura TaxID=109957 RepID=A0AAD5XIA9_9FUNG|nr:hypothetical protein HK100_007044 [Physocladia obscura]